MKTLLIQLVQTATEVMRVFEQQVGMSQTRLEVLSSLLQAEETSQASLQQQLGVDRATITRRVKQLEAEGFLIRRADPNDNRFTLVKLTDAGRAILADLNRARETIEMMALEGLDEVERRHMQHALERVRENMHQIQGRRESHAQDQVSRSETDSL